MHINAHVNIHTERNRINKRIFRKEKYNLTTFKKYSLCDFLLLLFFFWTIHLAQAKKWGTKHCNSVLIASYRLFSMFGYRAGLEHQGEKSWITGQALWQQPYSSAKRSLSSARPPSTAQIHSRAVPGQQEGLQEAGGRCKDSPRWHRWRGTLRPVSLGFLGWFPNRSAPCQALSP